MLEMAGMTTEDLRASADQLCAVLEAIDDGTLEATGRQRAFIAGVLETLHVLQANPWVATRLRQPAEGEVTVTAKSRN